MGQHKLSADARFMNKLDFMRRLMVVGAAIKANPVKTLHPIDGTQRKNPLRGRYRQKVAA